MTRVLVIEDEESFREALSYMLTREGYEVFLAPDGASGIRDFDTHRPDLVLLDIMLPEVSGTDVCRAIRAKSRTPIIMLTAKDSEVDKVVGLEIGADDYVTKPFSPKELVARIKAVLRRRSPQLTDEIVQIGHLCIDPVAHRVMAVDGASEVTIDLGPTEFRLLHFLMTHPERVHARDYLLDKVWGDHVFVEERTVDVHIKRLRASLAPTNCQHYIETVRGSGYRFTKSPAN